MVNSTSIKNLYEENKGKLMARAFNLTFNIEDAEDLVQITMEKVSKNIEKLDDVMNFLPWAYTILRNSFIDQQRQKKNINFKSMSDLENYEEENNNKRSKFSKDDLKSCTSHLNQESDYIVKEKVEFTLMTIEKLKPQQRDIINMKKNGSSYEEIANELNIKIGTVMSNLSRIKEFISSEWERHLKNE